MGPVWRTAQHAEACPPGPTPCPASGRTVGAADAPCPPSLRSQKKAKQESLRPSTGPPPARELAVLHVRELFIMWTLSQRGCQSWRRVLGGAAPPSPSGAAGGPSSGWLLISEQTPQLAAGPERETAQNGVETPISTTEAEHSCEAPGPSPGKQAHRALLCPPLGASPSCPPGSRLKGAARTRFPRKCFGKEPDPTAWGEERWVPCRQEAGRKDTHGAAVPPRDQNVDTPSDSSVYPLKKVKLEKHKPYTF